MSETDFMSIAWSEFMKFALEDPRMREAFAAATGEQFIDSARYVVRFVEWVTLNHWGVEHAPPRYREVLERKWGKQC